MFMTSSAAATTAAAVTAAGRSPSRNGTSFARASAFFSSERDGGPARTSPACAARARFLALVDTQLGFQRRCHRGRIIGIANGAYDHGAGSARGHYLADIGGIDATDREPRLGRLRRGVAHVVEPSCRPSSLRGR